MSGLLATGVFLAGACGTSDVTALEETDPESFSSVRVAFASRTSGPLGRPGEVLADPVVLQLLSSTGAPLRRGGVPVVWSVLAGGGTVSGASTTDASGRAEATWTLGDEGPQRLWGSAAGLGEVVEAVAVVEVRPIVYVANPTGWVGGAGSRLFTMDPDGSGSAQLTAGSSADGWPRWSPDGRKLAFVRQFHTTCSPIQGDLMILDVVDLQLTRVTDDGACGTAQGVSWSPDGSRVALSRNDGIVVVDPATGNRTDVTSGAGMARLPQWGPLGIAYALRTPGNPVHIRLVAPDGTGDRTLLAHETDDLHPLEWDPEGRRLSVFRRSPSGAGAWNWSVAVHDTETEAFSEVPGSTGGWWGAWSPDGTRLLVTVLASGIGECTGQNLDYILGVDLASGQAAPVTAKCDTPSGHPTWRPGG